MSKTQVSIIVPTYNRVGFVEQTIMSILDQDYPDLDLLVIDDGSADGTPELLERIADRAGTDRFRWVKQENAGQSATLNRGFGMVDGDLVGYVSSDDYLLPGAITKLVEAADANPEAEVIFPWFRVSDLGGRPADRVRGTAYDHTDILRWGSAIPGVGALVRRSFLDRVGGCDEKLVHCPDYEWWIRDPAVTFHCVQEVLSVMCSHDGSITRSSDVRLRHRERVEVLDRFFAQEGLPEAARDAEREAYASLYMLAGLELYSDLPSENRRWVVEDRLGPLISDNSARVSGESNLALSWSLREMQASYDAAEHRIEELTLSVGSLEDAARLREARIAELEAPRQPRVVIKRVLRAMIPPRLRPRATRAWRRLRRRPA